MRKTMTRSGAGLHGYLRTFSALHTFAERHPEDARREDGDIAERFWRALKAEAAARDGTALPTDEDEVEIEWPMALILATRA